MPRHTATTLISAMRGSIPMLAGLSLLSGAILMPGSASAEGGYDRGPVARHHALPPYAYGPPPRAHRCGPPRQPCHARGPYGSPALVRAYLPRNNALPMYNEPPPHFPEH